MPSTEQGFRHRHKTGQKPLNTFSCRTDTEKSPRAVVSTFQTEYLTEDKKK